MNTVAIIYVVNMRYCPATSCWKDEEDESGFEGTLLEHICCNEFSERKLPTKNIFPVNLSLQNTFWYPKYQTMQQPVYVLERPR